MSVIGSLTFLFFFYALQFKFAYLSQPQLSLLPNRLLRNVLPSLLWLISVSYLLSKLYLLSKDQIPQLYNYFSTPSVIELMLIQFKFNYILKLILIFMFFDYVTYWWHRFMHSFAWTSKLHRHHHSDQFVDTTTAYRFNLIELSLQLLFKFLISFILGIGFTQFVLFEYLLFFCGLFHHSRLNVPHLSFIVTPQFHFNHHLVDLKFANSNFGSIFTIWDKIHKTNTKPITNISDNSFGV